MNIIILINLRKKTENHWLFSTFVKEEHGKTTPIQLSLWEHRGKGENKQKQNLVSTSRSSSERARLRRLEERRLEARTAPLPQNLGPCQNKGETDEQRHKDHSNW